MTDKPNNNVPKTNSSEWKKNEKIINENPALKRARDIAQGLEKPAHKYTGAGGGTGRLTVGGVPSKEFSDNWDRIFGKKDKSSGDGSSDA